MRLLYRIYVLFLIIIIVGSISNKTLNAEDTPLNGELLLGTFNCHGPIRSTPVSDSEYIYVGSDNGYVFALDRKSAKVKWTFHADAAISAKLILYKDLLLFTTKNGSLYALRYHDSKGEQAWHFKSKAKTIKFYGGGWDYFVSSPVVAGNFVYFGSGDNHIYALNINSGTIAWQYDAGDVVRSTPEVDIKTSALYCGTLGGELLALDLNSGKIKWKFKTAGSKYFPKGELLFKPTIYKGLVFVGSRDASFYAVNTSNGTLKWKVTDDKGAWYTTSIADNDTIYAASSDGHYIQALDYATGKEKWKYYTEDLIFSTPLIDEGILYVGSHDSYIYAIEAQNGTLKWRFKTGDDILGSAIIDNGMVIIGSDDGILYGLNTKTPINTEDTKLLRTVYFDPFMDEKIKSLAVKKDYIQELYQYFHDSGYQTLDSSKIKQFIRTQLNNMNAQSSVIVLASLAFPYDLYQNTDDSDSLIHQYLKAGGTIVSIGNPPLLFTMKKDSDSIEVPVKELIAALEIDADFFYRGFSFYDSYISYPTAEGKKIGYPEWWSSGYGIAPEKVTSIFGVDEHGRAIAWIKSYGGPEGSGLLRIWGNTQLPKEMGFLKKIVERKND